MGAIWRRGERSQRGAEQRRGLRPGLIIANAVIVFVLAGHALSIAFEIELWPFSSYPMYSTVRTEYQLTRPVVYAVLDDSAGTEVPLRDLAFFSDDRAQAQLLRAYDRDTDLPHLRGALANLLALYEANQGEHPEATPPLRALRLYRANWELAAQTESPTHRELIIEIAEDRAMRGQ